MTRTPFEWDVEQEETPSAIGIAAAVSAWWESRKQTQFAPVAVRLVTPEAAEPVGA
jgi:hypothetical protein